MIGPEGEMATCISGDWGTPVERWDSLAILLVTQTSAYQMTHRRTGCLRLDEFWVVCPAITSIRILCIRDAFRDHLISKQMFYALLELSHASTSYLFVWFVSH